MLNKNTTRGGGEQDILDHYKQETQRTLGEFQESIQIPSVVNDSVQQLNIEDNYGNEQNNSTEKAKVLVKTLNPYRPSQSNITNESQTVNSIKSDESNGFYAAPQSTAMYDFIERGGYSGTFILIAGIVLMLITFLITFMVLTYFNI